MSKSSACTVAVVECSAHINQDAAVDMRRGRQAYARLRGASVLGKVCWAPVLVVFFLMTPYVYGIKCFEGKVTYCGINADGGALPSKGGMYYVQGMNWACQDQQSNMDPTFIAPNCSDQESCEALQTDLYDDPFAIAHEPPYNYVADIAWISEQEQALASSGRRSGTEDGELEPGSASAGASVDDGSELERRERRAGEVTTTTSAATTTPSPSPSGKSSGRKCPANQPACGLQTTIRRHEGECEECYTRFRYSADMGAIYWNIWQIEKKCVEEAGTCVNSTCNCTREAPYYEGSCSVWAQSACRRKAYKCLHFPADYVVTTFQDYDIKFCSLGPDDPECSGCVACTDKNCIKPVIHVSKLVGLKRMDEPTRLALFQNDSNYNCTPGRCDEAPRTCWNEECAYTDDCWPECDATIYEKRIPAAVMGFYVTSDKGVMVEQVKCCDGMNFCNYPNPAAAVRPGLAQAMLGAFASLILVAIQVVRT